MLIFINTSWNIVNFRSSLIKVMQKHNYEVHALAPEDEYSHKLPAMGVWYHPLEMDNSGSNFFDDMRLMRQIYRTYKQIQPQLILHYTVKPNIYGSLAAGYLGIPPISTVSGLGTVFLVKNWKNYLVRKLYRTAFKYPHQIFFQNEDDQSQFEKLNLLSKNNYKVVPGSGINTQYFSAQDMNSKEPFTFLMLSRLLEEKGVREYAQAAEILQAKGLSFKCQLAGNPEIAHRRGIPRQELQKWVEKGIIEYLGEVSDVRPLIEKTHAVILPSYREGLPKSLLEAASMSKPIVATRVPGCTDVVKDQINGLLCEPGDAWDLAEKMETLFHMPVSELREYGAAGRKIVESEFDEDLVIDQYMQVVQDILKK